MPLVLIESFREFADRQGCEYVTVENNNSLRDGTGVRHLFANGATSDGKHHSDPPTDPDELLRLRLNFVRTKREQLIGKYHAERNGVQTQAEYHKLGAGPPVDEAFPGWEQVLKKLVAEITQLDEEQKQLILQMPQTQHAQQYEANRQEQIQRANDAMNRLNSLPTYWADNGEGE